MSKHTRKVKLPPVLSPRQSQRLRLLLELREEANRAFLSKQPSYRLDALLTRYSPQFSTLLQHLQESDL